MWEEEYEDHLAEIAKKKEEEITETKKEDMVQDGDGQKKDMVQECNGHENYEFNVHDLGQQIRDLVVGVKELLVVMKIMIFVAICAIVLNAYDVLIGWKVMEW